LADFDNLLAIFVVAHGLASKKIADFFKIPLVNWKKSSYNKV